MEKASNYDIAIRHRVHEGRTAPGERGMDLYARELFPDAAASPTQPVQGRFIDQNGIVPIVLTAPAFDKSFKDTFDTEGITILDLGCGSGNLARDQAELGWKSKVIGIDLRGISGSKNNVSQSIFGDLSKGIPPSPNSVLGSWLDLPFADGSMDFILAYESFPRYMSPIVYEDPLTSGMSIEEYQRRSFEQITRVAKHGCIWRGTIGSQLFYPPNTELGQISQKYGTFVYKNMLDHGRSKIITLNKMFIALKN